MENLLRRKSVMTKSEDKSKALEVWAAKEASRCLQCDVVCNKCVDVCPNRANVVINTGKKGFDQGTQIIHIDAYCNECGNCARFCPWDGRPYKDKLTVFSSREDFENSTNNGFYLQNREGVTRNLTLRLQEKNYALAWDGKAFKGSLPPGEKGAKTLRAMELLQTDYDWYNGPVEA